MSKSLTLDTLIPSSKSLTVTWSLHNCDYANVLDGTIYVFNTATREPKEIILTPDQCSVETYDLTGLDNGSLYSVQIRISVDTHETILESLYKTATPSGKPDKPVVLSVTSTADIKQDRLISAVVQLGADNGNSIDNVIMDVYNNEGTHWTQTFPILPGLMTVTVALTTPVPNNNIYSVTALAVNEAGFGPSSNVKQLNLTTLPNAPILMSATSLADGEIKITFDVNELETIRNTNYYVYNGASLLENFPDVQSLHPNQDHIAEYTLRNNIQNGTVYELSIKAINSVNVNQSPASNKKYALPVSKPRFTSDGSFNIVASDATNSEGKVNLTYTFGNVASSYHPVTYTAKFFKNGSNIIGANATGLVSSESSIILRDQTAIGGDVFSVEVDLASTVASFDATKVGLSATNALLKTEKAISLSKTWVLKPAAPKITLAEMIRLANGNALTIFYEEPENTGGKAITHDQFRLTSDQTIITNAVPHTSDYFVFTHDAYVNPLPPNVPPNPSAEKWSINSSSTFYVVSMRCSNDGGLNWSDWSLPVTKEFVPGRPMPEPTGFVATRLPSDYGDTFVDMHLTWLAPTSITANEYELYRVEPDGTHIELAIYDGPSLEYIDRLPTEPKTITYQLRCFGEVDGQAKVASKFVVATATVSYAPKILYNNISTDSAGHSILNFSIKKNNSALSHVLIIAVPDDNEETNDMIHEIKNIAGGYSMESNLNADGKYYFSQDLGYKMSGEMFIIVASNDQGTSYFDNITKGESPRNVVPVQPKQPRNAAPATKAIEAPVAAPAKAPVAAPAKAPVAAPAKTPVKAPVATPAKAPVKAPVKK